MLVIFLSDLVDRVDPSLKCVNHLVRASQCYLHAQNEPIYQAGGSDSHKSSYK